MTVVYPNPRPALEVPPTKQHDTGVRLQWHVDSPTPQARAKAMHPADLADHRATVRRRALNALERDATRLAPLVVPREREALRVLIDAVHKGEHEPEDVHRVVRQCLSEQARRAA